MSGTPDPSLFIRTTDPLYNASTQPAQVDESTSERHSNYITAITGGSGTLAAPLNNTGAAAKTSFEITQGSQAHYRWDTLGLRMKMVFTLNANAAAACAVSAADAGHQGHDQDDPTWPALLCPFLEPHWSPDLGHHTEYQWWGYLQVLQQLCQ